MKQVSIMETNIIRRCLLFAVFLCVVGVSAIAQNLITKEVRIEYTNDDFNEGNLTKGQRNSTGINAVTGWSETSYSGNYYSGTAFGQNNNSGFNLNGTTFSAPSIASGDGVLGLYARGYTEGFWFWETDRSSSITYSTPNMTLTKGHYMMKSKFTKASGSGNVQGNGITLNYGNSNVTTGALNSTGERTNDFDVTSNTTFNISVNIASESGNNRTAVVFVDYVQLYKKFTGYEYNIVYNLNGATNASIAVKSGNEDKVYQSDNNHILVPELMSTSNYTTWFTIADVNGYHSSISISGSSITITYEPIYTVNITPTNIGGGYNVANVSGTDGNTFWTTASLTNANIGNYVTATAVKAYNAFVTLDGRNVNVAYTTNQYTINYNAATPVGYGFNLLESNHTIINGNTICSSEVINATNYTQYIAAKEVTGYHVSTSFSGSTITITYAPIYTVSISGAPDGMGGYSLEGVTSCGVNQFYTTEPIETGTIDNFLQAEEIDGYNANITVNGFNILIQYQPVYTITVTPANIGGGYTLQGVSDLGNGRFDSSTAITQGNVGNYVTATSVTGYNSSITVEGRFITITYSTNEYAIRYTGATPVGYGVTLNSAKANVAVLNGNSLISSEVITNAADFITANEVNGYDAIVSLTGNNIDVRYRVGATIYTVTVTGLPDNSQGGITPKNGLTLQERNGGVATYALWGETINEDNIADYIDIIGVDGYICTWNTVDATHFTIAYSVDNTSTSGSLTAQNSLKVIDDAVSVLQGGSVTRQITSAEKDNIRSTSALSTKILFTWHTATLEQITTGLYNYSGSYSGSDNVYMAALNGEPGSSFTPYSTSASVSGNVFTWYFTGADRLASNASGSKFSVSYDKVSSTFTFNADADCPKGNHTVYFGMLRHWNIFNVYALAWFKFTINVTETFTYAVRVDNNDLAGAGFAFKTNNDIISASGNTLNTRTAVTDNNWSDYLTVNTVPNHTSSVKVTGNNTITIRYKGHLSGQTSGDAVDYLVLSGYWDEDDINSLSNILTKDIASIDIRNAIIPTGAVIPTSANPNLLIYANSDNLPGNTQNVIANGRCDNLVITDGYIFSAYEEFNAETAIYERSVSRVWGTLVLPFAIDINNCDGIEGFYTLAKIDQQSSDVNPWMYFTEFTDAIPAFEPIIFKQDGSNHIIIRSIDDATISLTAEQIESVYTTEGGSVEDGTWYLIGSLKPIVVKPSESERQIYYIAQDKFWHTTKDLTNNAFRCYFETTINTDNRTASPEYRLGILNSTTSIDEIAITEDMIITPIDNDIFDLNGHRILDRSIDELEPGLYIVGGKKILIH